MTLPVKEPAPALRVVHLLGGLRAFDFDEDHVVVGADGAGPQIRFARPPYPKLYTQLERLGLQPIGVQFITSPDDLNGVAPVRWEAWRTPLGLNGMQIAHEWSFVRSKFIKEGELEIAGIAGKITTYLRLLKLRLRHLSDGYHSMLRCRLADTPGEATIRPGMFSNLWGDEIDAAIHAYFADATSLRDALAEACWKLVLKRADREVTTIAGLMKHGKADSNAFIASVLKHTEEGAWIKNLTDLRNEILHVVPVDGIHEHSFLDLREHAVGSEKLFRLHYPLTTPQGGLRRDVARTVDYSDEAAVRQSVLDYDAFAKTSGDALEYAWTTLSKLNALAEEVRIASGLKGEMVTFTDKDLAPGSVRIRRG